MVPIHLIYQTPVVDFENRAYSFIALLGKLSSLNQASLSGTERKDYESQLKLNEMKIVYPSNVQETSAFVFQNGFEKMSYCDSKFYTRQYMFHNEDPVFGKVAWNSRIMSRFCEVSDVNPKTQAARKFGWLFVGSFDLSCNSWGEVSVKDRGVCIWSYQSYELGVLHIPQKVNTPEGPQLWSPDFSTIVLPYNETTLVKYPQYAYPIMQRPDSHHPQLVGRLFFKGSTVFIQDTFPRNKQEEDFIGDPQLNKNNWNAARASCYHDTPARLRQTTINKCPGFVPEIGSLIVFHVSPPSMNPFQSGRRSKSQQGLNVLWICDYMYPERHEKTEMENGESKDDLCMNFAQLPLSDGPNGADAPTEIPKQTNQPTMVRYTGMKVIGLEADPYTLTISSPGAFEVKRPERRDVFLKKMLYNIHGVDVTKPSVQAQRRLRRARALLVSTKKKMLDVKTAGGLDRKN
uniref:Uncharacterized protein LOC100367934 n=1 Tax=Saccoglossus kowalevskii TaxID=10224 RepID=A0ABM0MM99_SACKO|nr:PREDICTED: uncharacterized protein LOC100367934 [Saccoglossus kowalevskii]